MIMSCSYASLDPLRIPLEDILIATKHFSEENLLKRSEISDVYTGVLPLRFKAHIHDVVIRKYNTTSTFKFYEEIKRISSLKFHRNVVSFIGFCDEKNERMIVMEHVINGSLDKYLTTTTTLITCSQRLHICFGAALALTDILKGWGGFKILLDKDWEAKVLICIGACYETDVVYSFGVILMEVVYGRKVTVEDVNEYQTIKRFEELENRIDPNVRKQMLLEPLFMLLETTYECLKEEPKRRPCMYEIGERLKKAFNIQWKHENILRVKNIAYLKIPLKQIMLATHNFADTYCIIRHDDVYKANLIHFEAGKSKTVIIKRVPNNITKASFIAEIEMLSSCKHLNLLSFLGYCDEDSKMILIFECDYIETLNFFLRTNLSWEKRIRISLDIARGLRYLHNMVPNVHQVITSAYVFLDENWTAKIANYNLFVMNPYSISLLQEYEEMGLVGDNIYYFGVFLFEILTGRLDYPAYMMEIVNGFASAVDLKKMTDPMIKEEAQYSLDTFTEIIYRCLTGTPSERPTFEVVIMSLEKALDFQTQLHVKNFESLEIPLSHIKLATDNFSDAYRLKPHEYDMVYEAELHHIYRGSVLTREGKNKDELPKKKVIIIRIFDFKKITKDFFAEIEMLSRCKHPNLISLLGFCDEDNEMILVFECAFRTTLHDYLGSTSKREDLSWEQQIRICLDIAHGLKYLRNNMEGKSSVIHKGIHSANILLDENWTAKIANFRLTEPSGKKHVVDDIFLFGVILFEILTGRLDHDLLLMANKQFDEEKITKMVDPGIMEEAQYSLETFFEITSQCLALHIQDVRPTFDVVIKFLEKALHIQNAMSHVQRLGHLKIPLEDIKSATNNFDISFSIGSGGYGEVYRAELIIKSEDERPDTPNVVAIKRIISKKFSHGIEGFLAEFDVASKCKHPNIVSLVGFCIENGEMLLVYELASNGSLDDYLENINMTSDFTWAKRLKICIDIAHGLKYMHTTMEDEKRIIHRDIKSANILLGKNWDAKIADFGLSKVHHVKQGVSTVITNNIAGTNMYLDPEYARTGRLKKASDIYSFGVVLFEIFSGKLAYDSCYIKENEKGLAAIARKHFKKGTLKEILDPRVMDKAYELGFTGKVEPNYDSLDVFSRIAYLCVAKLQDERPTIEVVTEELEKALYFQENRIKTLKVSLDHIRLVEELLVDNYNMRGEHGMLYKGEVPHKNSHKKVVVKRFSPHKLSSEREFLKEFEVLFKYKHENIIGLLGYCEEMGEKIIVYEHASKGTLDKYVNDTNFSWTKRLKVCIDIANGLKFLHDGGDLGHDVVIHRDIKSSNILLNKDWKAKICGFDHSLIYPPNERFEYVKDNVGSSPGYCDPSFLKTQFLTKESDIYSFGVILFEILCGRLARPDFKDHSQLLDVLYKRQEAPFLDVLVKRHIQEAPLEEIVFKGIKEQIGLNSLDTFGRIAFQCLLDERKERPTSGDVVVQLQKALKFQESYETHEARSHRNVKRKLCKSSEIYSTMAKKDILSILSKNILLQNDKLEIIRVLRQTSLDLEEEDDGIGYGDCDANDYQEDTLKKENTRNVLEN